MTSLNQDFTSYAGDVLVVDVTVRNKVGAVIDLSDVSGIVWNLRDEYDLLMLSKSKAGGDIIFITDGTDGQIAIVVSEHGAGATADLYGWYSHEAYVVDAVGNLSTFETGRGLFGPQTVPDEGLPSMALREDGGHALREDGGLELRE